MAPSEPPSDITIRVKVPQGHIEGGSDEFTLGTLPSRSKIGEVRLRIQQTLPSNPGPERQRLLYAGRALIDNDQTLTDALNTRRDTTQTEYVIHLLVKGEQGNGQAASSGHVRAASTPNARAGTPRGTVNAAHHHMHGVRPDVAQGAPSGFQQPIQMNPHQAQLFALQNPQAQQQYIQAQMQMQQRMMLAQQQQQQQHHHHPQHPFAMPHVHGQVPQFQQPVHHAPAGQPVANDNQQSRIDGDINSQQATDPAAENNASGPQTGIPNSAGGQPQNMPGRPISGQGFYLQGVGANGNRFEIHQQTTNIPLGGPHGQQLPFPMGLPQLPGMGLPFPMPGMAQQPHHGAGAPPPASGALERARQNVAEMRRMVDEMRNENATEEERTRVARMQENIDAVNNYIDPFGVARMNGGSRSNSPLPPRAPGNSISSNPFASGIQHRMPHLGMPPQPRAASTQQLTNPSNVTCYLLSSPSGPQALLLSPEHGSYTGTMANNTSTGITSGFANGFRPSMTASGQPAPTPTQPAAGVPQPGDQAAAAGQLAQPQAQPQAPAQAQAQVPAAVDAGGPLQALLNHFWLLFRVLIFAYFLLGANMGWRRPLALLLISAGFWMIRNGLFGDGGVARRWWDGIVRVDQDGAGAQQVENGIPANEQVPDGQMPTPEQVAARILREREEAATRTPMGRAREFIRPAERAAALFVASLWPGVGEAHVRAREAEERRLAEAEVERRRLEEEAKREAEEQEKERIESEAGEKAGLEDKETSSQEVIAESNKVNEDTGLVGSQNGEKSGMPSIS